TQPGCPGLVYPALSGRKKTVETVEKTVGKTSNTGLKSGANEKIYPLAHGVGPHPTRLEKNRRNEEKMNVERRTSNVQHSTSNKENRVGHSARWAIHLE
ncbi:MAG: hypothetical protein KAJ46_01210, partial [Sedimentisphaerales bacterium]|nr:hypothetical protein [Sedimentisphaerales bacterium]